MLNLPRLGAPTLAVLAFTGAACTGTSVETGVDASSIPDSGAIDSAIPDASPTDSALSDSALSEAASLDASGPDAKPTDTGQPDSDEDALPDTGAEIPVSPVALIYSGPGGCDGCHQAVAHALEQDGRDWQVRYVEPHDITASALAEATLYVQPGGLGTLAGLVDAIGEARGNIIADFVHDGGFYLGFCMGGFYASSWGIGLLPGGTPTWNVAHSNTFVPVSWRGDVRYLFYEGGFYVPQSVSDQAGATIIARYELDDKIAAIVASVGDGAIGISGPHPEGSSWGDDPDGDDTDLVLDLLNATLLLGSTP